jgi:hypothetical protein
MLDKNAKCPFPALVDTERVLGLDAAMGTGLAVRSVFPGLHLSRVVLDFLFCCHNLEVPVLLGGRAAIVQRSGAAPFFISPNDEKTTIVRRAKKNGGGVLF